MLKRKATTMPAGSKAGKPKGKAAAAAKAVDEELPPTDDESAAEPVSADPPPAKRAKVMSLKDAVEAFNAKDVPLRPGGVINMMTLARLAEKEKVKFVWYMASVGPKRPPVPAFKIIVDDVGDIVTPPTPQAPYCDITVDVPPFLIKFFTGGLGEAFWRNSPEAPRPAGAPFYPVAPDRLASQMVVDISGTAADDDLESGTMAWSLLRWILTDSLGSANIPVIVDDADIEAQRVAAFAPGSTAKDRKEYTDALVKAGNKPKDTPYLPGKMTKQGARKSIAEAVKIKPAQVPPGATKEEDKKVRETLSAKTNFFGYVDPMGPPPPPHEASIKRAETLVPEGADGREELMTFLKGGGVGPLKILPLFQSVPGKGGHEPVADEDYETVTRNARGGVFSGRFKLRVKSTKDGSLRISMFPESLTVLKPGPNATAAEPEAGAAFPAFG